MPPDLARRHVLLALPVLLSACAGLPPREPLRVDVAGIDPLQGQGMELRFAVRLRVLNPNDYPIDFRGVFVELDVRGLPFAAGVTDAAGRVPAYGETVLTVPVGVSAFNVLRQALTLYGGSAQRIDYRLRGRLDGPEFTPIRFEHQGELGLPLAMLPPAPR